MSSFGLKNVQVVNSENFIFSFVIVFLMASWAPFIMESLINEGVVRLLLVSLTSIVMVSLISYFCALTNAERELINGFIHLKR